MGVLIIQFDNRVQEIELYYSFLRALLVEKAEHLSTPHNPSAFRVNDDLARMLKANAFLLLYNLVESSIRDGLTRIYDSVQNDRLTYDRLCVALRKIWIDDRFRPDPSRQFEATTRRVFDLVDAVITSQLVSFDPTHLPIAGNIDGAKVRDLAKRYGFSPRTSPRTKGGTALLGVKSQRNNLAHGVKSFVECGRDETFRSLLSTKSQVVMYLRQILKNIEKYIADRGFAVP